MAADSLVARHRSMPNGGWAWRSSIQAPHFHTDRDVGAASVGEGLLAAYAVTGDSRYLHAAARAGDYLLGVAEPADGGLRWPDWADPDGRRSSTHYTSFDDGAAGISDFLWKLSEATNDSRFRDGALAGMHWLLAQAKGGYSKPCPSVCVWRWTDDPSSQVTYGGVGMGQGGIILALDAFADRTGDQTFRTYARAGAAYLRLLTANGTRPLPEQPGTTSYGTGFLSGSAGAANVFLDRYAHDRSKTDLAVARRLLDWVNDQASAGRSGLRWPIMLDPGAGDDRRRAAGFEEGGAGIAWVNLRAYRATGKQEYRDTARKAAVWLRRVSHSERGGLAWAENPGVAASPVHTGLDSGAAGIGWVLDEFARQGVDRSANRGAARAALAWIYSHAGHDRLGAFWHENRTGARWQLRAEPSWHWGAAGIAAFAARLAGWQDGTPGGTPH